MATNIQVFNSPQFGEVRTAGTSDNPMFCLSDLCRCLGLSAKGVNQRLSDEVISNYPIIDGLGRTQQALFVNEDGLYDVILDSRKPEAKAFRKWITSEVLPSIRKTGGYAVKPQPSDLSRNYSLTSLDVASATGRRHNREAVIRPPAPRISRWPPPASTRRARLHRPRGVPSPARICGT